MFFVVVLLFGTLSYSQTVTVNYFKDQWLTKEVSLKKANYSYTVTSYPDGTVTSEVTDLKAGKVIKRTSHKDDEQVGEWINGQDTMDYDFKLKYSENNCTDSVAGIGVGNVLKDNDSLGYKAPEYSEAQFSQFLFANIVYPESAKENGISGKVVLTYTISKEGKVENVCVKKGSGNVALDKEAVRVTKKLEYGTPPKLNGVSQNVCVVLPIRFELR